MIHRDSFNTRAVTYTNDNISQHPYDNKREQHFSRIILHSYNMHTALYRNFQKFRVITRLMRNKTNCKK